MFGPWRFVRIERYRVRERRTFSDSLDHRFFITTVSVLWRGTGQGKRLKPGVGQPLTVVTRITTGGPLVKLYWKESLQSK